MGFNILHSTINITMEYDFIIKREIFLRTRNEPFEKLYLSHPKKLGEGSFGSVFKVKERGCQNAPWRAAKVFNKKTIREPEQMLNQINILKKLDHPNIIKIYEIFESDAKIHIVQDLCEGSELFHRLSQTGGFSEIQARRIFRQALQAINYCHKNKICHRDLKPQNFLFLKKDSLDLKIIDFGLAFQWQKSMQKELIQKSDKNVVGTAYYIAPEVLKSANDYDERCDIWSLGVILYILVTALPPFDGEDNNQIFENIVNFKYSLSIPQMKQVSNNLKDLIKKILVPANQRLTIDMIFKHPWMVNQPNRIPIRINPNNLRGFSKFSKTKKLAANFIASQLSSSQVEQLTRMFHQIDVNRDGQISMEELKQAMQKEGMNFNEIRKLMDSIDTDHNGKINYTEFIASASGEYLFDEQNIKRAFDMLDRDGNGVVEKQQLMDLFAESGMTNFKGKNVEQIVKECDIDGNGVIDYKEFRECLLKKS